MGEKYYPLADILEYDYAPSQQLITHKLENVLRKIDHNYAPLYSVHCCYLLQVVFHNKFELFFVSCNRERWPQEA